MKNLNHFLSRSLRWIGFEAISYQVVLLLHQLALFKVTDYKTYGLIGATFSLVYLIVSIADLGLESSISPFFVQVSRSKRAFRAFFMLQLIPNILFTGFVFVAIIFLNSRFRLLPLPLYMTLVLYALVLTETVKKTLRTAIHLAFLNRQAAYIEVGTILVYVSTIWLCYSFGVGVGLPLVFIPMLITSLISTVYMGYALYRFSHTLPDADFIQVSKKRVMKSRFCNFLNQISHTVFSSNFLVPFFALQFGFVQAGIFKFISHIAYGVTSIVRKTFGLTSDALLAQAKYMSSETKKTIFSRITQRLHHVLYGIVIFLIINHGKLFTHYCAVDSVAWPLIYLFLFICLSENLFIAYEKLYITQEKTWRLLAFNALAMAFTYGVVTAVSGMSQLFVLLAIISVRVLMFVLLGLVSFYTWDIKPEWKLNPSYVAIALCAALGFFVFF